MLRCCIPLPRAGLVPTGHTFLGPTNGPVGRASGKPSQRISSCVHDRFFPFFQAGPRFLSFLSARVRCFCCVRFFLCCVQSRFPTQVGGVFLYPEPMGKGEWLTRSLNTRVGGPPASSETRPLGRSGGVGGGENSLGAGWRSRTSRGMAWTGAHVCASMDDICHPSAIPSPPPAWIAPSTCASKPALVSSGIPTHLPKAPTRVGIQKVVSTWRMPEVRLGVVKPNQLLW